MRIALWRSSTVDEVRRNPEIVQIAIANAHKNYIDLVRRSRPLRMSDTDRVTFQTLLELWRIHLAAAPHQLRSGSFLENEARMADDPSPLEERNRIVSQLLQTDADLALTFIEVADTSLDPATTKRNIQNARKAYEDICRKRSSTPMSPKDMTVLQGKLDRIRENLRFFGESI
jgi:hypothetical protein